MICDALLQVAASWSRFCRRPAYWRFLTCVMQLRGRHRVDGVRRPKFDFHTDLDVQLNALSPWHDVDVGDVGLIEFLGMRAPEEDRVVAEREEQLTMALYADPAATLDDLREAVTTLEDAERIARRVLGGAHPVLAKIANSLRNARAALRAREETQPSGGA